MTQAKLLAFAALMAALSNILSITPFTIPISAGPFPTEIHFTQLPIFISGILAGPLTGLLTGAVGGLYMSFTKIPFIIGGLALLGVSAGLFAKKFRPLFSGILAWCVQAPYVFITDYVWFTSFRFMPYSVALATVSTILIKLTVEAVIASVVVEMLIPYIKRAGISFQQTTQLTSSKIFKENKKITILKHQWNLLFRLRQGRILESQLRNRFLS